MTKHTEQPDYAGLVRLLPMLRQLPDVAGGVTLGPQEAEQIKRLGFEVLASRWQVPRLPAQLVAGNPILEALADNVDVFWRPRQAEPDPSYQGTESVEQEQLCVDVATGAPVTLDDPTEPSEILSPTRNMESAAILAAINRSGGEIERRKLQKKFWRMGATAFNAAVHWLVTAGWVHVNGPMFHAVPQPNEGVPQLGPAGEDCGTKPPVSALTVFEKEQ